MFQEVPVENLLIITYFFFLRICIVMFVLKDIRRKNVNFNRINYLSLAKFYMQISNYIFNVNIQFVFKFSYKKSYLFEVKYKKCRLLEHDELRSPYPTLFS